MLSTGSGVSVGFHRQANHILGMRLAHLVKQPPGGGELVHVSRAEGSTLSFHSHWFHFRSHTSVCNNNSTSRVQHPKRWIMALRRWHGRLQHGRCVNRIFLSPLPLPPQKKALMARPMTVILMECRSQLGTLGQASLPPVVAFPYGQAACLSCGWL